MDVQDSTDSPGKSLRGFVAVTIVSKRYLALARVTAWSFREHNPHIPFIVLLADEWGGNATPADEPFQTIRLADLPMDRRDQICFYYNELELSYACTPYLIDYLLGEGCDGVIFLKQETLVLGSLAPEFDLLHRHSVLLTPHLLTPPAGPHALTRELNVLLAGTFNGGFLAFSKQPEARRVLAWWKQKTRRNCFRSVGEGLHFEQRWLDFIPSFAPSCHMLRDPGMNVGHWNLPERRIQVRGDFVTADGVPCRVFRFSGYEFDAPGQVTKYNARMTVESTGEAGQIFQRYQSLLIKAGHAACQQQPYAYARFDNGLLISDRVRRIYHDLGDDALSFGNPFSTAGENSFHNWLMNSGAGLEGLGA